MKANSLEIDDQDATDALAALERSLGFQFGADELETCRTVGDIYRIVARRLEGSDGEACVTAMTFYRLRRALAPYAGGEKLRPVHVLSELIGEPPRRAVKRIEAETRLQLPPLASSWLGKAAFATAAIALLGIIPVHMLYPGWTLLTIGLIPAAIWILSIDPGQFPKDCRTLGDLAKKVVALNYGHLLEAGARPRQSDQWDVLTEILSEYSVVPKAAIRADMLILPAKSSAA